MRTKGKLALVYALSMTGMILTMGAGCSNDSTPPPPGDDSRVPPPPSVPKVGNPPASDTSGPVLSDLSENPPPDLPPQGDLNKNSAPLPPPKVPVTPEPKVAKSDPS